MKQNIAIILILFLDCGCCSNEKPLSFIQNSKIKSVTFLMNVSIEARGLRNDSLHYYYSHSILKDDTLTIPSFEYFDDLYSRDSSIYSKSFDRFCKSNKVKEKSCLDFVKEHAKKIDEAYRELGAINVKSLFKNGRFIEFALDEKCSVFYLEDAATLSSYWKDKFSKLQKVDEKWYYECK